MIVSSRIALSSYLSAHCVAHQHRLRSLHLKARLHHSMHCCRRLLRIFCMCLRCLADVLLPSSPPLLTTAPAAGRVVVGVAVCRIIISFWGYRPTKVIMSLNSDFLRCSLQQPSSCVVFICIYRAKSMSLQHHTGN